MSMGAATASQYGQDLFVLRTLAGQRGGFFLDSGASNGVHFSNTLLLERDFGWRGICVEPNDAFFEELKTQRTGHCLNCCIYDHDGTVEFLEDASVLGGIISEYDPALLAQAKSTFVLKIDAAGRPVTVRKVARTLRSVLEECGAPAVIDYWSLDTEGSELTILRNFPFDDYSFRILTVEHNWLPMRAEIRAFLEGQDYRFAGALGCDDCYVRANDPRLRVTPRGGPAWRSGVWACGNGHRFLGGARQPATG
jgi:FkbM family methyltransferase